MPSRTLEDRVEDLSKLTATLTQQVNNLQKEINGVAANQAETAKAVAELKTGVALLGQQLGELKSLKEQLGTLADLKTSLTLLERRVEELKKTKEEWSRRLWVMAGPILGAVVGVLLGYFLSK